MIRREYDAENVRQFLIAVEEGDLEAVQGLLDMGVSVNSTVKFIKERGDHGSDSDSSTQSDNHMIYLVNLKASRLSI